MSTSFSTPASATSTTLPPPPSAQTGGSDNAMQRGANYFFGFLITFVALLFIFVGYGIGTRRRFARRRGTFMGEFDAWGGRDAEEQTEPTYWEPFLAAGGDKWSNMVPLSTTLLRKSESQPHSPTRSTHAPFPFWSRKPKDADLDEAPHDHPETLQVTMMIAMPSPEHNTPPQRGDEEPKPQVYQIGVARVPWEGRDFTT